jgi:ABC-type transport auxiliary lipoprotein component
MTPMTRPSRTALWLLGTAGCLMGIACQLRRPDTVPIRLIEPELLEPQAAERADQRNGASSVPVRMLDTQAREHIGRRVLHQRPDGELTEDPVWQWTSAPDRYLDTALRLELTSNPIFRLVDTSDAPALATTLLAWHLESAPQTQLVGAVELQFTGPDRVVQTQVVRASEPVSAELPGNLAAASGRLLRRLALECLTRVARER